MTALPIIERELRVASRKAESYWSRSGVVLGLGLLWLPALMGTFGTTTELNTFVFNGMLWAGFAVSCLAFLFTADAISRERREGTLGLLFLSRVRAGDLLLGKIGSSGSKGLCMLAAFLPMLMIPVLAGGVTGGEAFREGLVLLNTFWFSLCVGLWASAGSTDAFVAIRRACLFVVVVVLVPFMGSYCAKSLINFTNSPFGPHVDFASIQNVQVISPIGALGYGREMMYKISSFPFWISLGIVQGLAWLLLLFTGLRLRGSLREAPAIKTNPKSSTAQTDIPIKKRLRFLHAYSNPVDWLAQHQRGILTTLWLAAIIEVLYFASSWAIFRGVLTFGWSSVMYWVIWFFASASTDALFTRAGSQFFYESKRSGHLEMLVTTPLGPRGVMEGQWSALKKMLAWPVAIALTAMLLDEDVSLVTQIGGPGDYNLSWVIQCFITWGIDIGGSILGILAVCWFGMLFALKGKSVAGIILRGAALGTVVPAIFKSLYAYGAEHITFNVFSGGLWSGTMSEWLEEIIVMIYYLWLFRVARRHVLRELSGTANLRKKSHHASRITHHFTPDVTHATDVTA
jgi:ABC-type transport system involved in multi-copper enzyme maturation permease subunit